MNANDIKELLYRIYSPKQMKNLRIGSNLFLSSYKMLGIEKNYKLLIKNAANFFLEFSPTGNVHEMFYLYSYMLEHGYFSIKDFEYFDNDTVLLDGRYIMSGYGNCRQISGLYHDILVEISKLSNLDISCSKVIAEFNEQLEENKIVEPNHELNLVIQNGEYYVQDPTNYSVFTPNKLLEQKISFCCKSIVDCESIVIIPETFLGFSKMSENELIYHLQKMNDTRTISRQELIEIEKKIINKCQNNNKIIEEFYSENKEHIKNVYKKIKRFTDIDE